MCQDGSTVYPFNESQVRTIGRLKIEYTFLLNQNKTLKEMLYLCDSIVGADDIAFIELKKQIRVNHDMLKNREEKFTLMEEQFNTCNDQIRQERKKRHVYMGTTAGALVLLVIVLLTGG